MCGALYTPRIRPPLPPPPTPIQAWSNSSPCRRPSTHLPFPSDLPQTSSPAKHGREAAGAALPRGALVSNADPQFSVRVLDAVNVQATGVRPARLPNADRETPPPPPPPTNKQAEPLAPATPSTVGGPVG